MTAFIAICALFLAAATFLLVWPLLGSRRKGEGTPPAYVAAIVVVALLPIAAFSIYLQASNWDWRAPEPTKAVAAHDLKQVVAQLQEQLASKPDDIEGWKLLGRSATVMRQLSPRAHRLRRGQYAQPGPRRRSHCWLCRVSRTQSTSAKLTDRPQNFSSTHSRWSPTTRAHSGTAASSPTGAVIMQLAQQRWVELQNHDLPPDLRQVLAQRLAELEQSLESLSPRRQPRAAGGAKGRRGRCQAAARSKSQSASRPGSQPACRPTRPFS